MAPVLLATSLSVTTGPLGAEVRAMLLPPGFDGGYAPEGESCDGMGRIEVKDGVMVGAEFAISVVDLIEDPVDPRRISAGLWNEGGGGAWEDSAVIALSADGQRLTFDYGDGAPVVWLRC
jgi:hypothetical protein